MNVDQIVPLVSSMEHHDVEEVAVIALLARRLWMAPLSTTTCSIQLINRAFFSLNYKDNPAKRILFATPVDPPTTNPFQTPNLPQKRNIEEALEGSSEHVSSHPTRQPCSFSSTGVHGYVDQPSSGGSTERSRQNEESTPSVDDDSVSVSSTQ
jgi:hypothetical protein